MHKDGKSNQSNSDEPLALPEPANYEEGLKNFSETSELDLVGINNAPECNPEPSPTKSTNT